MASDYICRLCGVCSDPQATLGKVCLGNIQLPLGALHAHAPVCETAQRTGLTFDLPFLLRITHVSRNPIVTPFQGPLLSLQKAL